MRCKHCGIKLDFLEAIIPPFKVCCYCIIAEKRVKEEEQEKIDLGYEVRKQMEINQRKKYFRKPTKGGKK